MATNIGQYIPVFLPGEPPSLIEKPGRPQFTGHKELDTTKETLCAYMQKFFCLRELCPSENWARRWCSCLAWLCRDTDCLCPRSYGPIRVFFQAGNQKASLASLSLKLHPFRHLEGPLAWGPSLLFGHIRHIEGLPWLGFNSVDWHIRHLNGHPGWDPAL